MRSLAISADCGADRSGDLPAIMPQRGAQGDTAADHVQAARLAVADFRCKPMQIKNHDVSPSQCWSASQGGKPEGNLPPRQLRSRQRPGPGSGPPQHREIGHDRRAWPGPRRVAANRPACWPRTGATALALAWCQSCIIASIASRVLGGSSPLPPPRAAGLALVDEDRSVYPQVYRLSPALPGRRSWRGPAR